MKTLLYDMPFNVRGFVKETCEPDGDYYTIVLNSRYNYEQLCDVYRHEMSHINNDDFHSGRSVDEIEKERHEK